MANLALEKSTAKLTFLVHGGLKRVKLKKPLLRSVGWILIGNQFQEAPQPLGSFSGGYKAKVQVQIINKVFDKHSQ
jgi:hypothetical protein